MIVRTAITSLLSLTSLGLFINKEIKQGSDYASVTNYSVDEADENDEEKTRTETPFSGFATTIYQGSQVNGTFNYPYQTIYYRFLSTQRQYAKLNFSGPNAKLKIYYSNYFASSDYLTYASILQDAFDCYYFDCNAEYIIELTSYVISYPTSFSFRISQLDLSMPNYMKYVFHQTMDSSSNVGFHYRVEYFDVDSINYSSTNYYINSYSSSTNYASVIDNSTYWFYDPHTYSFTDCRRVVTDTGFDEYSAIASCTGYRYFNNYSNSTHSKSGRFTSTFISDSVVLKASHCIFSTTYNSSTGAIEATGLAKSIVLSPGVNDYSSTDYYGDYNVDSIYAPIGYILVNYGSNPDSLSFTDFDWAVCLTSIYTSGTRVHSYLGLITVSFAQNFWPNARSAGYPVIPYDHWPDDEEYLFDRTMWASYPLENDIYCPNSTRYNSEEISTSGGNSGGPLYFKNVTVQNGIVVKPTYVFGVMSAGYWSSGNTVHTSIFCRLTPMIINLIQEIMYYWSL